MTLLFFDGAAVTINILANDTDSDGTLVPSTVQITGTSNPGDPYVVSGEGDLVCKYQHW